MSRAESVHPRLRGELKKLRLRAAATNGSSPLTRGTRRDEYPVLGHLRFIPAYAGNSLLGFYRRSGRTVHPRLRGELTVPRDTKRFSGGSSPLTRGTQLRNLSGIQILAVHPRLRGELFCSERGWKACFGSSPLTRGTPMIGESTSAKNRFIPAYAGNSRYMACGEYGSTVHPRLRGELT